MDSVLRSVCSLNFTLLHTKLESLSEVTVNQDSSLVWNVLEPGPLEKSTHSAATAVSWACKFKPSEHLYSVRGSGEREQTASVLCLSTDEQEEGRGKHSCEGWSDTSTGGSKVSLVSPSFLSPVRLQRLTLAPAWGEESIPSLTRPLNGFDITYPVTGTFISTGPLLV